MHTVSLHRSLRVFDPRFFFAIALGPWSYFEARWDLKKKKRSCNVHECIRCKCGGRRSRRGGTESVWEALSCDCCCAGLSLSSHWEAAENNAESIQSNNIHTLQWISGWQRKGRCKRGGEGLGGGDVCKCVCVCMRGREREGEISWSWASFHSGE